MATPFAGGTRHLPKVGCVGSASRWLVRLCHDRRVHTPQPHLKSLIAVLHGPFLKESPQQNRRANAGSGNRPSTSRAVRLPHRVDEEHHDVPERHELEPSRPHPEQIARLLTRGSLSISSSVSSAALSTKRTRVYDETLVPLEAVENTLGMHPSAAPAKGLTKQPHLYRKTPQDTSFSPCPARQGGASRRWNVAACGLPPRNGGPHQAADAAIPGPRSPTTRCTGALPYWAMPTPLPDPPAGRAEAHSEPLLTRSFC